MESIRRYALYLAMLPVMQSLAAYFMILPVYCGPCRNFFFFVFIGAEVSLLIFSIKLVS